MRIELKLRSPLPFPISPSVPFIALKTWKFSSQKDHGEQKKKNCFVLPEHIAFYKELA